MTSATISGSRDYARIRVRILVRPHANPAPTAGRDVLLDIGAAVAVPHNNVQEHSTHRLQNIVIACRAAAIDNNDGCTG
eukprot:scaffold432304_cov35-Prasinocladus_malaysianus.AAC.1